MISGNRRRTLLLIIPFLLGAGSFAYGIDFQGTVFGDYYGSAELSTPYQNLRGRLFYRPVLSGPLLDTDLELTLSTDLYIDLLPDFGYTAAENVLHEAYLFLPAGPSDIYAGQKLVSFGKTDVFSPLNCVGGNHIYKLSLDDPYQGRRPEAMLHLKFYPSYSDELDLIYIPFPRPDYGTTTETPLSDSSADLSATVHFSRPPYNIDSPHSIFLAYSRFSDSFDFQLLYGFYTNPTPDFDISALTGTAPVTGLITSRYTRVHTFGGAFSTSLGELVWVEEAAFNLTEDLDGSDMGVRNPDFTLNSQITGTIFGGTFAQLNMIYQHIFYFNAGSSVYAPDTEAFLRSEFNNYFTQPVQNILFFIAHLHNSFFREKLYVALNAGFFFSTELYLAPRVSWALSDLWSLEAGADFWTAPPPNRDLLRGTKEDNFYIRVSFAY